MEGQRVLKNAGQSVGCKWLMGVHIVAVGLLLVAAVPMCAQEKADSSATAPGRDSGSIGFIASKTASAEDVGLPMYPGARRHKENSDDSPGVQFGLWGGGSGFKLVVLKLESNDKPEKVAAFYRNALAKYGKVWNCADSTKAGERGDFPNDLDCQEEHPESGETVLQAGTKEKKHIVNVKPGGGLSIIQLVYIEAPVSNDEK